MNKLYILDTKTNKYYENCTDAARATKSCARSIWLACQGFTDNCRWEYYLGGKIENE